MAERRFQWMVGIGALAVILLFALTSLYSVRTSTLLHAYSPLDDAYIFMRYADNIIGGQGVAWNHGTEPTYGTTSITYLGLVTLLRGFLPHDANLVLQSLSWGLSIAFVLTLAWVSWTACQSHLMRHSLLILLLLAAFIMSSQVFLYHSLTGMETTLSLLINTILIGVVLWLLRKPSYQKALLVALVGYLCYETHPETGLYAVLFSGLAIWLLGPRERRLRLLMTCLGCLGVLLVSSLVWKTFVFGSPLPLPFFVKLRGFYDGYIGHQNWNDMGYLVQFLREVLPFIAILLFTAQRRHIRLLIVFLVPVAVHFLYLFTVVQIMGNNARYFITALPFFVVPAMITLDDFVLDWNKGISRDWTAFAARLALFAFVVVGVSPLVGGKIAGAYRIYVLEAKDRLNDQRTPEQKERPYPELEWSQAVKAISDVIAALPSGTIVALSEVGYPGAVAPQVQLVDLAGLNDHIIAQEGFSMKYLLTRRPDLIWFPHYHYTHLVASFLTSAEVRRDYDVYPGAFDYGLAIRKNSSHHAQIVEELRKQWKKNYPTTPAPF